MAETKPEYLHGTIYRLLDNEQNFYIGSTLQPLRQRFNEHKANSKKSKGKSNAYSIFTYDKFSNNQITIEVIEEVVVENERQLRKIEDQHILKHWNNLKLVNTLRASRSQKERDKDNRDKLVQYRKEYSIQNKDKIQKYRQEHKEHINKLNKKYMLKNKQNLRVVCVCGSEILKYERKKHERTQKHQNFISNNN